jgi:hypothetical protein
MLFNLLKIENLRVSSKLVHWRPDLKVWRHLLEPMISWARLVSGGLTRSKVIQLATFAKFVADMVRKQGVLGLVQYLKTAHTMLMQGVPGSKLKPTSRAIGKRGVAKSRDGLPRVIPRYARGFIRRGDAATIRFWLTMLGMYRILTIEPKYKLKTITDPGVLISRSTLKEWRSFIRKRFLRDLEGHTGWKLLDVGTSVLERPSMLPIMKASADIPFVDWDNGDVGPSTSFGCRFNSAKRWTEGQWGWTLFRYLSVTPGGTGTTKSLWTQMLEVAEAASLAQLRGKTQTELETLRRPRSEKGRVALRKRNEFANGSFANGRLSVKVEPAGKARVFAMVDYWTQVAVKPLHDWIFSVLREIPSDGTFNQLEPVKRLLKKVSPDQTIYSYDLSAATDRLPVLIQGLLLWQIFGRHMASTWRALLCNRNYYLGIKHARAARLGRKGVNLRYAVGQPMGAFSSWAMLALTHHAMVQFAAYRAGEAKWFDRYAVLGDDIVIADDQVAREYRLLCQEIGLGIGIAKSLVARGKTLEFAKKFFFRGEQVSGLPIKFWAAAQNSIGVVHALSAWYPSGTLANFVRSLGVGFKGASKVDAAWDVVPRRLKVLLVLLTQPITGGLFAMPTWPDWLLSHSATQKVHQDALSELTAFSPWATGLQTEVLSPARDRIDEMQSDLFFVEEGSWDPAGRLVNAAANQAVAKAQTSIDLAEKSMQHLQSLNVKFNPTQTSAIFNQVVKAADKVDLIAPTAIKALTRAKEVLVAPVLDLFKVWVRLRSRMGVKTKGLSTNAKHWKGGT